MQRKEIKKLDMSKSNFNIRFYLRTNHVNRDGTCAIMVRITVNGERTVFSTKLSAAPENWDAESNHVNGKVHAGDWQKALTDYGSLLAAGAAGCTPLVQKLYRRLKDTWLGVVLLVALFWLCVWRVELEGHNPFKYLDF